MNEKPRTPSSITELNKLFAEQVAFDNKLFGIESIYLPNPVLTLNPKYCFVAMEPSLGRMTRDVFRGWVNFGFLNFLYSEEDFILHYCAYKFLCKETFDYQITDISKGAMNSKLANEQRNNRYSNWINLLKKEIEFFNNPKLITVGSVAKETLEKFNFNGDFSIIHYSQNNCVRFLEYYKQHPHKKFADNINLELKEFAKKVLTKAGYTNQMQTSIIDKIFNKDLSTWKKGLFLNYKDRLNLS